MGKRVVITKQNIKGIKYLVTALFEDHRMMEVSCDDAGENALLGNIYIGKIKGIAEKIGAAFVEIAPGQMSYLPLGDVRDPLMVKQCRQGKLTAEDEIVVQVTKEAVKTKDPAVSTNISLKGNAFVLTSENKRFGISKKLPDEKREYFRTLFAGKTIGKNDCEFGLIVRTNAVNYSKEQLFREFEDLSGKFQRLKETYRHRTCYSCLHYAPPGYVTSVRDYLSMHLEKIVTDDADVYDILHMSFLEEDIVKDKKLIYYDDPALSLSALYGLMSKLEEAFHECVWLKSGAYLVISPTEALTVIDVNSGKCTKGSAEDFYLKVNEEAAEEIARQLRLRNISGICIVDFINLDTKEAEEKLIRTLRRYLAEDTIPAVFVDFTKLGLAEITRKKVKKPLWEQITGKI